MTDRPMKNETRRAVRGGLSWLPLGAAGLLGACAQILGIGETEVTRVEDESVAATGAGSGTTLANGGSGSGSDGDGELAAAAGAGGAAPTDVTTPSAVCGEGEARCGDAGREVCTGGAWQPEPCPPTLRTCEAGQCVVRGPALVRVADLFYIDATEVTVAQYRVFLESKAGDTSGQPDVCVWNDSYEPTEPANPDDWPVSYVDWCDARAYCEWAGKRLCGKQGGGALAYDELFVPTQSEWFLACGGPSGASHPNANPDCNSNAGFGFLEPVGSMPGCEGFYPGLFDLEGNVAEWIDSCLPPLGADTAADAGAPDAGTRDGSDDRCMAVGGSLFDQRSYCDEVYDEYPRNQTAYSFGIRCCAD